MMQELGHKFCFVVVAFAILIASAKGQESHLSSSEVTGSWSYGWLRVLETGGSVNGGIPYVGKWKMTEFSLPGRLAVDVYEPAGSSFDVQREAYLTKSAFDTVVDIAGRPPVKKIELYLVPTGYSFSTYHRSWSFHNRQTVAYVIRGGSVSLGSSTVRDVSHELFHAWVGTRQSSQLKNERGAATIENCAELRALGEATRLDKTVVNASNFDRLGAASQVMATSLQARYRNDPELDNLFIDGKIRSTDANAIKLESLCRSRAAEAVAAEQKSRQGIFKVR